MRTEDFEFLYNLEENFWWFAAMRRITDTIVSRQLASGTRLRILDAGCGTGFNLCHYDADQRHDVYGMDIEGAALDWVRKRGRSKIAQASVTDLPFAPDVFDMVFSFDVVPQVPAAMADQSIREMQRVLKPGGYLFIRAAAYEWMRSSHDEELHTQHRFTRHELVERLTRAGFKVEYATYANCFLFPVVALRRLLKFTGIGRGTDVKPLPAGLGWMDPLFRRILLLEERVFRSGGRLPFGLSVICLARKLR